MSRARLLASVATVVCTAGLVGAADAAAAELLYGVDTQNRLVAFAGDTPTSITRTALTGLPAGEQIVGIDVRPANKQVVALGSSSRLYQVNVSSGAVTAVGTAPFSPALSGASFGFDFNPTVDRIRVTSDARQDFRLVPDTGALAATDGQLTYAAGDPGAAASPRIVGSAYTNNVAGATTTQLYDLDAGRDTLVLQNPPNDGTLVTVGPLGVDAGDNAGFDIAADGKAYAALQVGATSSLYTIDLATGRATLVGRIGGDTPIRGLTALGTAPADTTPPSLTLARVGSSASIAGILRSGLRVSATCSEGCTLTAVVSYRGTVIASRTASVDFASTVELSFAGTTAGKKALRAAKGKTIPIRVVVTAKDAAGNTAAKTLIISVRR